MMNAPVTTEFKLAGLSCGACVAKVTSLLKGKPGVSSVDVTLQPPQARVTADRAVGLDEMNQWLEPLGDYHAEPKAPVPHADELTAPAETSQATTYRPLLLVLAYLLAVSAVTTGFPGYFDGVLFMRLFMGGFFIAFSFFKLLDLRGFASAYRGYDLVAAAWPGWGLVYPFVELGLGLAYLGGWWPGPVNAVTAVVMAVSLAGVVRAVLSKRKIRCACLGTGFNLPMSTVTIVEDGMMLVMALAALFLGH